MGKMKILIILVLVLAAAGGGAFFFLGQEAEGSGEEKQPTAEELAAMSIDTDIITTNLASPNFGIVQFNILLDSEKAKEEAEKRTPEVRAAIISTVAGFTKEELVGADGIATLEEQLKGKLAEIMQTGKVERVLVTEFKVQ
ncbi:flagellar basal body-associated FliL family protein [Planococcus salinarum]|uniref:flagellar basal body-associated FliL family protein n=1 Tax=Planococcus salinarum TaxID=622695 RepID=UPI000E3BB17F|nr:flagellar basal body-associated FliL family protein [Planococcus salinarum]TAA72227.1 flagellar basal body-associated protein FliL [Planococcus salinarum]